MADTSLAGTTTRIERGIRLFAERRHLIERTTANSYKVPSCTSDEVYLVCLDLRSCTCPDHPAAKAINQRCKHVTACQLVKEHRRELRRLAKRERSKSRG